MGFLRGNNADDPLAGFRPAPDYSTPGIGDGIGQQPVSLDDIIAAGNQPPQDNFLAQIARPAGQAPQGTDAPRKKRSVLDIIGGVADALAQAGGATAGYSQGVDRKREIARQGTEDAWKEKFNGQKLQAGNNELQDFTTKKFAMASRGLNSVFQQSGAPGVMKAWPLISKQLGFSDEEAAIFGEGLASDPEGTLMALDEGMNGSNGSQPKEATIYKMLQRVDPTGERANAYLDSLTRDKTEITPYQMAMLGLRQDDQRFKRIDANRNYGLRERGIRVRENPPGKAAGKGGAIEPGAADNFRDIVGGLRQNYETLHKSGALVDPNQGTGSNIVARARASGIGQLVEGALGTQAQTERDKITGSRPALLQAIVKATGMSAKQIDSNAEMKLMLQQATDPTMSYQANVAALKRLENMVANLSGSNRRPTLKPRATPGTKPKPGTRLKFNPSTGKIE